MPDRTAVIVATIIERPVCLFCVAQRVNLTPVELRTYLKQIGRVLVVQYEEESRCRLCGVIDHTVSVDQV